MLGIFALLQQLKQLYVLYVLCQRKFSKKSLKTTAINKWNKEIKLRPKAEWVVYIEHCNLTPNPSPIKFTKVQAHCCHFITGKYFVLTLKLDKDNTVLLKYKCKTCCFYNILSDWPGAPFVRSLHRMDNICDPKHWKRTKSVLKTFKNSRGTNVIKLCSFNYLRIRENYLRP